MCLHLSIIRIVLCGRGGCDADVSDLRDVPPGVAPLPLTGAVD